MIRLLCNVQNLQLSTEVVNHIIAMISPSSLPLDTAFTLYKLSKNITQNQMLEFVRQHDCNTIIHHLSGKNDFYWYIDMPTLKLIISNSKDPEGFGTALYRLDNLGGFEDSKVEGYILDQLVEKGLLYSRLCQVDSDGTHPLYTLVKTRHKENILREHLIRVSSGSKCQKLIMEVKDSYHKSALDLLYESEGEVYKNTLAMLLFFCKEYDITSPGSLLVLSITSSLQLREAKHSKLSSSLAGSIEATEQVPLSYCLSI